MLSTGRLLTLTGAGGVGKTRLAVRMAAEVRRTFPDGVWFVGLAALRDPQLLAHTLANTLELRQVSADPTADLAQYLEDKQLLLVLDNCEHLSEACAVLASKLLASAPALRILATSRHTLEVEGERILLVPPLSTPAATAELATSDPTDYESVALFLDRAKAVDPDFEIVDANRAAVIELCRQLEGIPLAIELAAVWLRTLTPAQILDRLRDRFRLLSTGRASAPARQQALEAAIGWSFDLCSPSEQILWARLSVFSGGFDLEAAEEVCCGANIECDDVLELVANLVNKSVVTRQQATEHTTAWYQMLETIRQYGAARLADAGDTARLQARHRHYYLALANRFAEESFSPRQADWFIRVRREQGNLRAALDLSLAEPAGAPAALEIASSLWNFWFAGFLREGYRYLKLGLQRSPEQTAIRATALWAAGYLAMFAGEFAQTDAMLAECSELAERFDDARLRARIKECRGHAAMYRGDLAGALSVLEEALAGFRSVGDPLGEFDSLILLTATTFFLEDERAEEFSRLALALAERHGARSSKGYALWAVGIVGWRAGRLEEATDALREAIRLWQPMHDLTGISFAVQALSWCAASASPDEGAARLLGASKAVWRTSGAQVDESTVYTMFDERSKESARKALGQDAFERMFAEGLSYSFDEAVTLAMGGRAEAPKPEEPTSTARSGLTRRELEIAECLAQGLSNKEIAHRLVISPRTVETHVEHILSKLGLTSRAQVGGWFVETPNS